MWRASRTPAEWLNQLWNARGSAEPLVVPPASELDPALIDTLQSLYVHDDARLPDPHFLDQLEQTLLATAATTTLIATPPQQPNGRVASTPPPAVLATRPLPAPRSHEWMPAQLATAALVLLTLVGSFVAFGGPLRPRQQEEAPVVVPAIVGTPAANLPPGLTEDTILFQQRIDEIPSRAIWAGVERGTIAPGGTMTQGKSANAGVGPILFRVEQGTVSMQADGPITVTRAGTTEPTAATPGAAIELGVDDVVFTPSGVVSQWHNAGPTSAVVLDAGIQIPGGEPPPNSGWTYVSPIDALGITPPPTPAELTVRRLTLAPGASVPNQPILGLNLAGPDAGTLTVVQARRADPIVETGRTQIHQGSWMDLNGGIYIPKELRNDSSEPLTLLLMTVIQVSEPAVTASAVPMASAAADASAPPSAASPTALNPASPGDGILLQGTFDTLPDRAAWVGTERTTLQPGATWDLNVTGSASKGPRLFLVEAGALEVTADGPLQVTRAGSTTPVAASPGVEITLHEGDRGVAPSGTIVQWRNTGDAPTTVLDAWIDTLGIPTLPPGVSQVGLVSRWPIESLAAPVLLTVQQLTIGPGTHLAPATIPGLQGLYVESGTLHVQDSDEGGTPLGDFTMPAGATRVFGGPGYHEVPPSWTVSSADADFVTLIVLTLAPANELAGTPMN